MRSAALVESAQPHGAPAARARVTPHDRPSIIVVGAYPPHPFSLVAVLQCCLVVLHAKAVGGQR